MAEQTSIYLYINGQAVSGNYLITSIAKNDTVTVTTRASAGSVNKQYVFDIGAHKAVTLKTDWGIANSFYIVSLTERSAGVYEYTIVGEPVLVSTSDVTVHMGNNRYLMVQGATARDFVVTITELADEMKLVDGYQLDNDLTSVANAIRTKGGTSSSLAFPSEFVSAINAIPTGGGGGLDLPNNLHLIVGNFPERYLEPGTSPGSVTFTLKEVWYSTPTVQPGGYHDQTFTKTFTFDDTQGWEYYAHSIEDICTIFGISISSLHIGAAGEYLEMCMTSVTGVSSWSVTEYNVRALGDNWYFRESNYRQYQYAQVSNIVSAQYTDNARVRYDFVFEASWEDE